MDAALEAAVAHFAEHGWAVVRGAVAAPAAAALAAASEALLPTTVAASMVGDEGVPQVTEPSRRHPALAAWLRERRPFAAAAAMLGARRVQLLQDVLLVKPPRPGARLAWHQDAAYFGFVAGFATASVRLALGPCTVASGCMWVLDGTHREGLARSDEGDALVRDGRPEALRARGMAGAVAVELAPGDVSVHHALTFHGSFENTTDLARRTLVAHVASADAAIDAARLPPGVPLGADGRLDRARYPLLPVA
ncbi:MAG: phytanoyl-CoA dioxygenase family protein [Deltaproteobacteria bacterium]|nr:phytanoyl-CoA dioxygenase family protein [Deltaproteobacteria bacterium]